MLGEMAIFSTKNKDKLSTIWWQDPLLRVPVVLPTPGIQPEPWADALNGGKLCSYKGTQKAES